MATFIVHAIPDAIAGEVRTSGRAPAYGHPAHREVARGTGPCRECLRPFEIGKEERLLFTYSPFTGSSLAQPGPVFIHAEACVRHDGLGYPPGLSAIPIVAQAYYDDGTIAEPKTLTAGQQASLLERLLDEPRIAFAHLRHAEAGCFIARVERVAT
jgi:hypothetical protein